MIRPTGFGAVIVLGLGGASHAVSPVIDDFEAGGPFIFSCSTVTICPDYQNIGSHGLDDVRLAYIHGNGNDPVSVSLVNTPYDDALSVWGVDAFLGLHWDPNGIVDITDGPWNSIHLRMDAPSGTVGEVNVHYDAVNSDDTVFWVDPVVTVLPLPQLNGDLHAVDRLSFVFALPSGPLPYSARVSDIRFGWGTLTSFKAVVARLDWCLACPPESLSYDVFHVLPSPFADMIVRVEDAVTDVGIEPFVRLEGFDSGDATGAPGLSAGTSLWWDASSSYATTTYDFLVELAPTPGHDVALASPPRITFQDSVAVALEYVIVVGGAAGPVGSSVDRITMDVAPGQPLAFRDASVTPVIGRSATAAAAYRLSFTLEALGDVDESQALMASQIVGDWAPGPSPVSAPVTSPPVGGPGLVAAPSVTRDLTVLQLARPPEAPGTISIFDVAGRVARRLELRAGSSSAVWDGRDAAGRRLPAGVYWASFLQGTERVTAKIVRVP
jgi:hypothetical protein